MIKHRQGILMIIVFAQFLSVSPWFAGNGVMDDLMVQYHLPLSSLGHLTSAVQFGFIAGTLIFAIFAIADRFSPSKVFLICSIAAAVFNIGALYSEGDLFGLLISRFATGFFLAGVYPVGMKIASDYYNKDLGKALGFLLAALVLGTAFPHFLKTVLNPLPWDYVMISTSLLSLSGGLLIFFMVPDGPFRKQGNRFERGSIFSIFKDRNIRSAAFGYFGHMWELYAFWAFLPVVLAGVFSYADISTNRISIATFLIIGIGSLACILGGFVSHRIGSRKVAFFALACSGACCLISPFVFSIHHYFVFGFLLFWGMMVVMDSPQFSTMVAQAAPVDNRASVITFVNCIGFAITIISIQLLTMAKTEISYQWLFLLLLPGPLLGLAGMMEMNRNGSSS